MDGTRKYQQIQNYFRKRIQSGQIAVDQYLPSEHEICAQFSTTRTTVRKALDGLVREGFVEKEHGRGSRVLERGKSLELVTIKGFSGSTNQQVETIITQHSRIEDWGSDIVYLLSNKERQTRCVYFQRIRNINGKPVVIENTWYSRNALELIKTESFVEGSFLKHYGKNITLKLWGSNKRFGPFRPQRKLLNSWKYLLDRLFFISQLDLKPANPNLTSTVAGIAIRRNTLSVTVTFFRPSDGILACKYLPVKKSPIKLVRTS